MAAETASTLSSALWTIGLPVLMLVALYFFAIRPQQKRDKEARNMLKSLKVGDRIVTIGGIYGTVKSLDEERVVLLVGTRSKEDEKVTMTFRRDAVRNVEGNDGVNEGDI